MSLPVSYTGGILWSLHLVDYRHCHREVSQFNIVGGPRLPDPAQVSSEAVCVHWSGVVGVVFIFIRSSVLDYVLSSDS